MARSLLIVVAVVQTNPYRTSAPPLTAAPAKFSAFTHLEANVKEPLRLGLGACTLILGKNRVYKTAILDAIRLALTGKHPIGHNPSDLLELAANPKEGISISLQGPSLVAEFELSVQGEAAKKPDWYFDGPMKGLLTKEEKENILPPESVKELLSYGHKRSVEAVLKRFGPKSQALPQPPGLDEIQLGLWHQGVLSAQEEYGKEAPAATILAGIAAWMRRAQRSKSSEANDLEEKVATARKVLNEEAAGSENLDALKRQREQAMAWERSAMDRQRMKQLEVELVPLRAHLEEALTKKDVAEVSHKTRLEELIRARDTALDVVTAHQKDLQKQQEGLFFGTKLVDIFAKQLDTNKCPFCSTQGVNIRHHHQEFTEKVEARRKSIEATMHSMSEATSAHNRAAQAVALEERSKELFDINDTIGVLKGQISTSEARIEEIARRLAAPYGGPPSSELSASIERIEIASRARGALEEDAARFRRLKKESEDAKTLAKEAMLLAEGALKQAAQLAADTITKYMPAGLKAHAKVDEKSWEWCAIGMDGRAHREHGASGSEWMSLALALPVAWTEGNPLRVAMYDDKDLGTFDKEALVKFLAALRAAVERGDLTQVFVVWNRPEELAPADLVGWTVLQRDPHPSI